MTYELFTISQIVGVPYHERDLNNVCMISFMIKNPNGKKDRKKFVGNFAHTQPERSELFQNYAAKVPLSFYGS